MQPGSLSVPVPARWVGWLCLFALFTGATPARAAATFPEGDYYVVSRNSGKVLTAVPAAEGTFRVVQAARKPGPSGAQLWHVKPKGAACEIVSKQYAKCLDVTANNPDDDAPIGLWERTGGANQTWQFLSVGACVNIVAAHSGKDLNVSKNSHAEGAPVVQYAVDHNDNSLWMLYKADAVGPLVPPQTLLQVGASTFDNAARAYHLEALPDAALEAARMGRNKPADCQPSGLYVAKGEAVTMNATGVVVDGTSFYATVGQRNAFFATTPRNDPFVQPLHNGSNTFTAPREGILYFYYVKNGFQRATPPIDVTVQGGSPLPLYVNGKTTRAEWKALLTRYARAPWVEMVDTRALITVSRETFKPLADADPGETFHVLRQVLATDDALSGFDSSSFLNVPTPLRTHYVEDTLTSAKDLANVYMYAGDHFIGMTPDSVGDLVKPDDLKTKWAIWHETGHTYQQQDWTWSSIVETSVNIYSLAVQAHFGQPNRLDSNEEKPTKREIARAFLSRPARAFDDDKQYPPGEGIWARLVLFAQLGKGLGDGFYPALHKYYRQHPLPYAAEGNEDALIQAFVQRSCRVSHTDLTAFFVGWGFRLSDQTRAAIGAMHLAPPPKDLAAVGFAR